MDGKIINATLEILDQRTAKLAASSTDNTDFEKMARLQKTISDKIRALVTLGTSSTTKESELVWKAAAKLHGELDKTAKDVMKVSLLALASMEANFYERTGLMLTGYATEIRELVRAMDPGKRMGFVQAAIEKADTKVLGAIIHADVPAVLTGFNDDERQALREQLFKTQMPEAVATREAYRDLVDHVNQTIVIGRQAVDTYGNPAQLKAAEAASAAKVSAKATLEAAV